MKNMKEYKLLNEKDLTPTQVADKYAAECKMTETEWSNFNKCLNDIEFEFNEKALIKTLSNIKAIIPSIPHGGHCDGSTFIPDEPMLFANIFEISRKTLLNHCYYEINKEDDTLPERTPNNIHELAEWTLDMFENWRCNIDFAVWMNQNNDKFMCIVRLWYKFIL